jgi:hypothetical protein
VVYVDFENEYILPRIDGELFNYLDADEPSQWHIWCQAWAVLSKDYPVSAREDIVVGLHGVIIREHFGVRSLVEPLGKQQGSVGRGISWSSRRRIRSGPESMISPFTLPLSCGRARLASVRALVSSAQRLRSRRP